MCDMSYFIICGLLFVTIGLYIRARYIIDFKAEGGQPDNNLGDS